MTIYTIETAPIDVLRKEYTKLREQLDEGKDDRQLGWWISHNAASVTLTTHHGETITATGKELLDAIKAYHREETRRSAWRAA